MEVLTGIGYTCAVLIALIDYVTMVCAILASELRVFGKRIPLVSFLTELAMSEIPVWTPVAVKCVLFLGVWSVDDTLFELLFPLSILVSLLHKFTYLSTAYQAKKVADLAVERFCDHGELSAEVDSCKYVGHPIKAAFTQCQYPIWGHHAWDLEEIKDLTYATPEELEAAGAEAEFLKLNVYRSKLLQKDKLYPVAVYIHGGSWSKGLGSKENRVPFVYCAARENWISVSINYRLFPANHWPDYVIDCKRAIRWIKQNIHTYGGDKNCIVVSGGSAGGHLASLLGLTGDEHYRIKEWQPGFEDFDTSIHGCIPWYPPCDTSGEWWNPFVGKSATEQKRLEGSPKHHAIKLRELIDAGKCQHKLCPFLIIQGESDVLVPKSFVRNFYRELKRRHHDQKHIEYVEFPNAQHSFDLVYSPRSYYANFVAMRFMRLVRDEKYPRKVSKQE